MTGAQLEVVDLQEQAREVFRQSMAAELKMTGAQLGKMFARSDRWGRDRIAEVKAERTGNGSPLALPDSGSAATEPAAPVAAPSPAKRQPKPTAVAAAEPAAAATAEAEPAAAEEVAAETAPPADATAATETGKAARRVTTAAVAGVAAVAALNSYLHMQELAAMAGEGWRAWLLPFSVDGLLVAAALAMLKRRRRNRKPSAISVISLVIGIAASLAANFAVAAPTVQGRLVAVWPPIALAFAFELLLEQRD